MKHIKIFITVALLLSGACFTTSAQTGTGITFVDNVTERHTPLFGLGGGLSLERQISSPLIYLRR